MGWASRANKLSQDHKAGKIKKMAKPETFGFIEKEVKFDPMEAMIRHMRRRGVRPSMGGGRKR